MEKSNEQRLIDILFEIAFKIRYDPDRFKGMSEDDFATAIRYILNGSGFKTEPMGSSWAVLKSDSK